MGREINFPLTRDDDEEERDISFVHLAPLDIAIANATSCSKACRSIRT